MKPLDRDSRKQDWLFDLLNKSAFAFSKTVSRRNCIIDYPQMDNREWLAVRRAKYILLQIEFPGKKLL